MRRWETLLLTLCLMAIAMPVDANEPAPACANGQQVVAVELVVDGETATGCRGEPATDGPVDTLVVFAHGHGQSASVWTDHMQRYADEGVPSITMDYRGAWDAFPLQAGAEDTIAAAQLLSSMYPSASTVVVFGVSMGGAVSGMALSQAPPGTFTHWFMVEGLSTLTETWAEASAVEPATAAEIEAECGGTPLEVPEAYVARSAIFHTATMKLNGLEGAVVVHPLNDGRVPIDQGLQTIAALTATAIPTESYLVLRAAPGEQGNTGTGALGLGAADETHQLSGHGWEGSSTQIVMATAFARLDALIDGREVLPGLHVADHELGTLP